MSLEIRVPALGESIAEATLGAWLKQAGQAVAGGEPICELETDKVNLEVPAPEGGVLAELKFQEGDTVTPGAVIAVLAAGDGAGDAAAAPVGGESASGEAAAAPDADAGHAPSARKILAEKGVDPETVAGSGRGGRITKADALAVQPAQGTDDAPAAASASGQADTETRVRMTRLRQTIARRLKQAQDTAAILTTFNEADMSAAIALRAAHKEAFERKHGVRLGFMGFFVKACVHALRELPAVNAEIDGAEIVYRDRYDIGVAVGTPNGLVVPVVRGCDRLTFAGVEAAVAGFGRKARDGSLEMSDLAGGTFTISNGGVYGSLMSTPILNPPQSGILGMHKIQERPVAVGGQVVIRPMMYLALSYDHRIVDGREAVTFLVRVKECIEDPARLLLDL